MVTSSPGLFAGSYVLHRLLTPRHPPCALLPGHTNRTPMLSLRTFSTPASCFHGGLAFATKYPARQPRTRVRSPARTRPPMALQNHVLGAGPTRQFIPGAGPSSNFPPLPDARRIGERSQGSTLGLRRGLPSSNRPGGAIVRIRLSMSLPRQVPPFGGRRHPFELAVCHFAAGEECRPTSLRVKSSNKRKR